MSYTFDGVFTNVGNKTVVLTLKDGKVTVAKPAHFGDTSQKWEVQFDVGGKPEVPLLNKGTSEYIGWDAKFTEAIATPDKNYVWEYGTAAELVGGKFHFEATVAPNTIYSLVVDKTKPDPPTLRFALGKVTDDYGKWTLS